MFNVGDYVYIKENAFEIKADTGTNKDMTPYLGGVYKIRSVCEGGYAYKLEDVCEEDSTINFDGYWMWDEKWLEPASATNIEVTEDDFMNMF